MPYMLLIHEPIGQRQTRTLAEGEAVFERMLRFAADLKERGVLTAVESLASQDNDTARVKVRNGRAQVLDGPFAEAKEIVGGFFLLNVGSRDDGHRGSMPRRRVGHGRGARLRPLLHLIAYVFGACRIGPPCFVV